MARRNQFTCSAESVQGNAEATVTFRSLKVREWKAHRDADDREDTDLLISHVVAWEGIEGDDGHALPSPKDDAAIIGELYMHEQQAMVRLLMQGPDGEDAKN